MVHSHAYREKLKSFISSAFFRRSLPRYLLYILASGLFIYTAARACLVSITHDEAGSFLIWTDFNIFNCHYNPECWGTANLHWLYVLLMKPAMALFGTSEPALRFPALLGHLIYLYFSYRLVLLVLGSRAGEKPWLFLLGFLLLNVNPYLLDFFSLARGYGLAMAMMMCSLYFFGKWIKISSPGNLLAAMTFAALAVLSNFTMLLYLAALAVVTAGILLVNLTCEKKKAFLHFFSSLTILLGITGLLGWLIYRPIQFLSNNGEFQWGTGTFLDTISSLIKNSLYGARYLKMYNLEVAGVLLGILLVATLVMAIRRFVKAPREGSNQFLLGATLLPLLITVASIAQHHLTGSQYLVNRTALLFIPLVSLVVFLFFKYSIDDKKSSWKIAPGAMIGLFCLFHFLRVAQFKYTAEWIYDFRTKDMLAYLNDTLKEKPPIKLGVNWIYHPSSTYYFKTREFDFAEQPLIYSKSLLPDQGFDYYFVEPGQVEALRPAYKVEKCFDWVGCLMKRND